MIVSRRKFIATAGIATLGLAARPPLELFAEEYLPEDFPLVGKRWALVINLPKCHEQHDCTKCIDACHSAHNVPDYHGTKDEVKWIWKESFEHAFLEHEHEYEREDLKHAPALLLCNHCNEPPCVSVCPTHATWKRKKDGIVMMDWHRCIGCRYCIAACPYGSRSFNYRNPRPGIEQINVDYPTRMRGVVEKCTFCEERLARGEIPACVEACEVGALVFGDLEEPHSEVRRLLNEHFTIRRKPELGTQPQVYYII